MPLRTFLSLLFWPVSSEFSGITIACGRCCFCHLMIVMSKVLDTDFVKLELLDSGILVATYKRRMQVNLSIAREIVRARLAFAGRMPRPVLVKNEGVVEMDREAREYVTSGDGIAGISAAAILTDQLSTIYIMSFIQTVATPFPMEHFAAEEEAMRWLSGFLD